MPVAEIAGQRPNEGVESAAPTEAAPSEPTPAEPSLPALPQGQSVIPRRMGESYLPTQP
jgi:hypothetical protein